MTLIDKDEALLPCPFCGGPVGIERGETAHAIVCIAPSTCHDSGLLVGFAPEDEAEAIAAWNTRADLIPATALAVPEVAAQTVGEAALEHMLDRRGISGVLEQIRDEDPEVWREICEETGRAALAALRRDAEHVNQTAETEHDAGNVLTDAAPALSVPEVAAAEQRVARIAASLFPGGYDANLERINAALRGEGRG